jgi:hypothetical protein
VWSGSGGGYTATLAGAFPSGRTVLIPGAVVSLDEQAYAMEVVRVSDNTFDLTVKANGVITPGALQQSSIIVRVYPA